MTEIPFQIQNSDGCCLECEEAHEGCWCSDCMCHECEYYDKEIYTQPCGLAAQFKAENRDGWKIIVEKMRKSNRFWRQCPSCGRKRFMKYNGPNDELANWFCPSCKNNFKGGSP